MSLDSVSGKCIILSAPSGAGKTSIAHALVKNNPKLSFSISACSRAPRENEHEGVDYYFISQQEFKSKIENNEFLEWQEVYKGHYYGTLQREVERIWKEDKVVVFDVDVVGGMNLKRALGEKALSIFVAPPSMEILEKRLRHRSTESEAEIQIRLDKSKYEMSFAEKFDRILVNNVLSESVRNATEMVNLFMKV